MYFSEEINDVRCNAIVIKKYVMRFKNRIELIIGICILLYFFTQKKRYMRDRY